MKDLKRCVGKKISVVVPVYKVEQYLDRCVESILNQTYHDFELILVDDGSPDNSGNLCDNWARKDSRINVIHKSNGGLSSARNAGLDEATGEYVTFIDSDDVIHWDYLAYLLTLCAENNADISMGKLIRFSEDIPDDCRLDNVETISRTGKETLYRFFEDGVEVSNYVSACCKLYRRSIFENIRFPEGRLFEDEYTTYRLYDKAGRIVESEAVLYYYYVNPNSITSNLTIEKRMDEYDAQWDRICYFNEKKETELYQAALNKYLATAQWDFIESKKGCNTERIIAFQNQFKNVLSMSRKANSLTFLQAYDYYVLAYPQRNLFYRIYRQLLLISGA